MRKGFWHLGGGFSAGTLLICYAAEAAVLWVLFGALPLAVLLLILWKRKGCLAAGLLCAGLALSALAFWVSELPGEAIRQTAQSPGRYGARALDYSEPGQYGHVAKVRLLTKEAPVVMAYLPLGAELAPGDIVFGAFSFSVPENKGSFAARRYYRAKGISLTATVKEAAVSKTVQTPLHLWPAVVRRQAQQRTEVLFPAETAVLKALLFGDRSEFDPSFRADVSVTGMAHIFAVSGMHLSFLVSVMLLLCRRKKLVFLPAVLVMLAMMAVTGFPPSIVRAGVMQTMALAALVSGREEDGFSALLLALVLLLALNPWAVADVGLQFSFLSVFGLLTVARRLSGGLINLVRPRSRLLRRGWEALVSMVSAAVSAQLATAPLVMLYFGQVSLVAVLANLLILWCVSAVFLGALAALILSLFWKGAAGLLAWPVSLGSSYIRFMISLLAKLPLAFFGTGGLLVTIWACLSYLLGAAAYALRLKKAWRLAMLLFCLLAPALWGDGAVAKESVSLWALDMGDGQCIVFAAGGKTVVVDCGSKSSDAAESLLAHFRRYNLKAIDALILTHLDADHASGAGGLLERGLVKRLYLPRFNQNEEAAAALFQAANRKNTAVFRLTADEKAVLGQIWVSLFLPPGGSGGNAGSLAILAESKGTSVLILGDIDEASDEILAKTRDLPAVSALVAGHHGAKTATSQRILEKTAPQYAIISVGRNAYGHPAPETLARFAAAGCDVRRTDENGTVFLSFYKGKIFER